MVNFLLELLVAAGRWLGVSREMGAGAKCRKLSIL